MHFRQSELTKFSFQMSPLWRHSSCRHFPMTSLSIRLSNGRSMPQLGIGTYKIKLESEILKSLKASVLESDYKLIDSASVYRNEAHISKAIQWVTFLFVNYSTLVCLFNRKCPRNKSSKTFPGFVPEDQNRKQTQTLERTSPLIGIIYSTFLLRSLNIKRDRIFITSKLSPKDQGFQTAQDAIQRSLINLDTDYIDL